MCPCPPELYGEGALGPSMSARLRGVAACARGEGAVPLRRGGASHMRLLPSACRALVCLRGSFAKTDWKRTAFLVFFWKFVGWWVYEGPPTSVKSPHEGLPISW
jgi:hypothetical protein